MSLVAKAYGSICEALDTYPKLQSFLEDQIIEWAHISIDRLDKNRAQPGAGLLDFTVLPLPSRSLSLPEKAMVIVAIYNARCAGRDSIDPCLHNPPEGLLQARIKTLIQVQAYDIHSDEFGLTMDDLSTIRSYVDEMVKALSVEKQSQDHHKDALSPSQSVARIHASIDEPPAEFCKDGNSIGPVHGNKTQLGFAMASCTEYRRNDEKNYRNAFVRHLNARAYWCRSQSGSSRNLEVFCRSFRERDRLAKRLESTKKPRSGKKRKETERNGKKRKHD